MNHTVYIFKELSNQRSSTLTVVYNWLDQFMFLYPLNAAKVYFYFHLYVLLWECIITIEMAKFELIDPL